MLIETEAHRQFYLGMAGIELWYARQPQPGAAPSPDFHFEEFIAPVTLPRVQPGKQRPAVEKLRSDEGLATVQDLMKDVQSQSARNAGDLKQAEPPAMASVSSEAPAKIEYGRSSSRNDGIGQSQEPISSEGRYSITATWAVWIAESLVLVSVLSPDSSDQLQDSLATNILRSMGESVETTQTFIWPVFSNPVVPGNDAEGFRQLLTEFAKDCQKRAFLGLGLLSDAPPKLRAAWLEQMFGSLKIDFPHGLAGIATDPGRKRALWSELKPLVSGKQ